MQGPLDSTIDDFWRMIWETNASIIVMLTKEIELNKVKCSTYWPDVGQTKYIEGGCTVSGLDFVVINNRIERRFVISDGVTNRDVTHLQYVSWPGRKCGSVLRFTFLFIFSNLPLHFIDIFKIFIFILIYFKIFIFLNLLYFNFILRLSLLFFFYFIL